MFHPPVQINQMKQKERPLLLMIHGHTDLYGSGKIFMQVLEALQQDFDLLVVLPREGAALDAIMREGYAVQLLDVGTLESRFNTSFGMVNRALANIGAIWNLIHLIRRKKVDLVYTNTFAVISGPIAARLTKRKSVWHCHESLEGPKKFMSFTRWLIKKAASLTIAVSDFTKNHWAQNNPELIQKIKTIRNGIDPLPITKNNHKRNDLKVIRVGIIARITAQKGVFFAVEVLKALREQSSVNIEFVWVGDAVPTDKETLPRLKSTIRENGLESRFLLPGFRTDIGNFLQEIDIYFHPNVENDSFPTTILEAMYARLPVVAGNQGGATEMIKQGATGYLVSTQDTSEPVAQLMRLANDQSLREKFGENGYQRMQHVFTKPQFAEKINLTFHQILAE